MIREIHNARKFLIKLDIKWWSVFSTTILCFLDSMSNVLLLLGIGQIAANQLSSNSTKGNILKLFFGDLISSPKFTFIFVLFLGIKVFSIALKKIKIEQIKTRISNNMFIHWSNNEGMHSSDLKTSEITNFFSKGIIGFLSDSFFLIVVFAVLLNYNSFIGALFIAFIALNIFLVKLLFNLNKKLIDNNRKNKNRLKRKQKFIKQNSLELQRIDRLKKEQGVLSKRVDAFNVANSKLNVMIGIAEAITPLSFFSFLLFIAHSNHLFSNTSASTFLEITLLLIYSQGSLRRNMRATRYWINGNSEVVKFLNTNDQLNSGKSVNPHFFNSIATSKTTSELNSIEKENLVQILENELNYHTQFRYIRPRKAIIGENIIEALSFRNSTREKNRILELAAKLDSSGNLHDLISTKTQDFQHNLTSEQLFFYSIIQSELDNSELILFDQAFLPQFNQLFQSKPDYLKKTYLCQS